MTEQRAGKSLWRNLDYQSLWISRTLATVGKETVGVAYALLILADTGSATYAGAAGSLELLVVGLVSVPAGVLADRADRRAILLVCDVVRMILFAVFSVLVWMHAAPLLLVFAIVAVSAVCLGMSNPPALAAIKELVPPTQLTRATAQNQIRPLGATVIASPIGTSLFGLAAALPFVATAVSFACSAPLLLLIKRPMQPQRPAERHRGDMVAGLRFIVRQPILLAWVVWIMGSNLAFNHSGAFLAVIATGREHGASATEIGLALTIAGTGGLIGALPAEWVLRRVRPNRVFLAAAWIGPVGALLLAVVPGVLPLGVILGIVFLRGPISNALFFGYVAALVPDRRQGTVVGAVMFLSYITQPLGVFVTGAVFDAGGPHWVFGVMAVVSVVAALPTLARTTRRMPAPDELTASTSAADSRGAHR